jgi:hypothetical protein
MIDHFFDEIMLFLITEKEEAGEISPASLVQKERMALPS